MEKKPYEKPAIRRVELKSEEAALTACKVTDYTGPGQADCQNQGGGKACQQGASS